MHYVINREVAKISRGKIDKYEYLTGEETTSCWSKYNDRTS